MDHRKGKARELANYKDSVQIVSRSSLPRFDNIVSSHNLFSVKYDGERGKTAAFITVNHLLIPITLDDS